MKFKTNLCFMFISLMLLIACSDETSPQVSNQSNSQYKILGDSKQSIQDLNKCKAIGVMHGMTECQMEKYVVGFDSLNIYLVEFNSAKSSLASHLSVSQLNELKSFYSNSRQVIIDGRPNRVITSELLYEVISKYNISTENRDSVFEKMPIQFLIPKSQGVSLVGEMDWMYSQKYVFKGVTYEVLASNTLKSNDSFEKGIKVMSQSKSLFIDQKGIYWIKVRTNFGLYYIKGLFNPKKLTEFATLYQSGFATVK